MRLAALITFIALSFGSFGQDLLVQRFSSSRSINSGPLSAKTFYGQFGMPVQAGNTLLVSVSQHSPTTTFGYTLGDDKGNIYTPVRTNNDSAGKHDLFLYVATNVIAGARMLFATNRSGNQIVNVQIMGAEFYGVLAYNPVDVSKGASGSSTSAATGNMTPGTTGDLVVQFAVGNISGSSITCPTFTNADQANLAWTISITDHQDVSEMQYGIYNSTTAFSPTVTFGTSQAWNTVAVCLKASPGQGSPRPSGIYIAGLFSISQPQTDNSFGAAGTPLTNFMQWPSVGNLQVQAFTSAADNIATNTVSSGSSGTWVNAPLGYNRNNPGHAENTQFLLASNWVAAANGWQFVTNYYKNTTSGTGGGVDSTIKRYDIVNAAIYPYDTRSTNTGTQSGSAASLSQPGAVTPAKANSLVITEFQENTETPTNIAAPFLFDSFRYDGEGFSGPQNMDQSGGWAHFITTNSSSTQPTWAPFDAGPVGTWAADMIVLSGASISGLIMPTNRFMPWVDAVGVKGGIPDSSAMTVFATIAPTTDSASIVTALNSCPSNQVVKLQAGTFNLTNKISAITSAGVVLKGAGMSNTIVNFPGTSGGIYFGTSHFFNAYSGGFPSPTVADVTSGYTQGSSNLVVSSTAGMVVGNFMVMDQSNNLAYVNINGYEGNRPAGRFSGDRALQQFFRIESTNSATSVTVWPPVAVDYWASIYGPQVWWMSPSSMQAKNGVEDMTVDIGTTSGAGTWQSVIGFESCRDGWVKNVMGMNASHSHIGTFGCFRMEIRHCYFFNTQNSAQTSYGITGSYTQLSLDEDNILNQIADPFIAQDDYSLNVWAYNFTTNNYYAASAGFLLPSFDTHATHSYGNLAEGNHGTGMSGDFIHGSGENNGAFRNRFTGWSPWTFGGGESVNHVGVYQIDTTNRYFFSVGNLLGTTGKTTNYASVIGNEKNNYIYSIGLNNGDGYGPPVSTWPDDQIAADTSYRHMDYDVVTGGITYSTTNDYVTLPRSLYKSDAQIATLLQGLPAFNPTNHTVAQMDATNIPAGFRFAFGADPSQDPIITVQPSNQTVTAPAAATFSVTATGTAPITYQWLKNGTPIGGATSSGVSTGATTTGNNGDVYAVQVTSAVGGPLQSVNATLTVNSGGGGGGSIGGSNYQIMGGIKINGSVRTK